MPVAKSPNEVDNNTYYKKLSYHKETVHLQQQQNEHHCIYVAIPYYVHVTTTCESRDLTVTVTMPPLREICHAHTGKIAITNLYQVCSL